MDNKVFVAEFTFPFPAIAFENELKDKGIDYQSFHKKDTIDSVSFFVSFSDVESTITIKKKIEVEDAISTQKHIHPILKLIAYVGLPIFVIYSIYKIFKLF